MFMIVNRRSERKIKRMNTFRLRKRLYDFAFVRIVAVSLPDTRVQLLAMPQTDPYRAWNLACICSLRYFVMTVSFFFFLVGRGP